MLNCAISKIGVERDGDLGTRQLRKEHRKRSTDGRRDQCLSLGPSSPLYLQRSNGFYFVSLHLRTRPDCAQGLLLAVLEPGLAACKANMPHSADLSGLRNRRERACWGAVLSLSGSTSRAHTVPRGCLDSTSQPVWTRWAFIQCQRREKRRETSGHGNGLGKQLTSLGIIHST